MSPASIKVARLLLDKGSGELTPLLEECMLVIPDVSRSEHFIPKLVLAQPNGTKTLIKALEINDLGECTDARAFGVHAPSTDSSYFWCTLEISDKEFQRFKDAFAQHKRAFLELNMTMGVLLANLNLFSSMQGMSAAKQLALNPHFQDHASVFETCLEQDPSLVDFEYATDLMNNPHRRGSLYDYLVYLSSKKQ